MSRKKRKIFVLATALTLGLGVLAPYSAMAETGPVSVELQAERVFNGKVLDFWRDGLTIKTAEGTKYHVGLHQFSDEQFDQMQLQEGADVQVTGQELSDYGDFYTFDVYKRDLPKGITEEEMQQLEKLYNESRKLEKEENWEESAALWQKMDAITRPYYLAEWEPETFEEYIQWYEFDFSEADLQKMRELYEEWVVLAKAGKDEEAGPKMDEFYQIIQSYYVPPTFEESIADIGIVISDKDLPVLKKIYEEAIAADQAGEYELSEQKWNEYHKIMRPYYREAYPSPTFEEYMKSYDFEVSAEDKAKLADIYADIIKKEENDQYDEMYEQWDEFYKILDPYFQENNEKPFLPSKLTVNGVTFEP